MNCYRFESIEGKEPLFDSIDATYVLHLENNGRIESIKGELREFFPSENTFILYNKGYKKCKKQLPKQETRYDIVHANLHIFKHAKEKRFRNILILEDDFFFNKEIRDHCLNVDNFVSSHNDFIYFLGNVPAMILPYSWNHYRATIAMGSHAVIYSESYRNALLRVQQDKIEDWDVFQLTFKPHWRFMYYKPLCYQLFPITENSKGWGNGNVFIRGLGIIVFQLFQFLKMNIQTSPGYPFFYFTSKVIFWLLLLIVIFVFFPYKKLNESGVFSKIHNRKYATRKYKIK